MTPRRPLLRYHGGKWRLAPWIIAHLPPHRVYVEPFGGAASVLLRKPRSYAEIYNDLSADLVNLFRVVRDRDTAQQLIRALQLTPFARTEFYAAYEPTRDQLESARRLVVRSFMGFGSDGHNPDVRTGFRGNSNRSGSTPAHDWCNLPDNIALIVERVAGIIIENRPAVDVMRQHDGDEAVHYVDPPYMPETRSPKNRRTGGRYHAYTHEMSADDHDELLAVLQQLRGAVVLSGYPSALYLERLKHWRRVETAALADGAKPRTECLWINPAGLARLEAARPQGCILSHITRAAE